MKMVFSSNLSSMTLAEAFKDLFKNYANRNDYESQLNAYLIAFTLGTLEDVSLLEELVSNPDMDLNPFLVGNMKMDLEMLSDQYGTEIDKKIASKIHKKVKRNAVAIREDIYLK